MFDVSRLDGARPIRIHGLFTALQALAPAVLISGDRTPRRAAVLRYVLTGGLSRSRALYVEASTSTAAEADLMLLGLARAVGLPILVYIPDAYQLFPDLYPRRGWRTAWLDWGWRRSVAVYRRVADVLLFPSRGLAECFHQRLPTTRKVQADVLPPAGQGARAWTPPAFRPPTVVYAGATGFHDGSDLLLSAMERVVARHTAARCHLVTPDANFIDSHRARRAAWLTVESTHAAGVAARLRAGTLGVIPRRVNPYNDLAAPVKLFDYMAAGRPVVVTACRDTAALVDAVQCGLVVADEAEALADGILRLVEDRASAERLGENGYRAVQAAHSWPHRAERILQLIRAIERGR
jgi:glycosyltransferase involved in cell wall biosynthesis